MTLQQGIPTEAAQGDRQVPQGPQAEEGAGGDSGRPGARLLGVEGRPAGGHPAAARARFRRRAAVRQLPRLTGAATCPATRAGETHARPCLRSRAPVLTRRCRRRRRRPPRRQAAGPRVNPTRQGAGGLSRGGRASTSSCTRSSRPRCRDVPKEATPQQIDQHQRALAALIQAARKGAAPGRHLRRDSRPVIRKLLVGVFAGPTASSCARRSRTRTPDRPSSCRSTAATRTRSRCRHAAAGAAGAAASCRRSSNTASSARPLILLDVHAHIIVDFMTDAMPR